jgi:hypothetical protein
MPVPLQLRVLTENEQHFLLIEADNQTNEAITLVAHPRYLLIEVENEFGQYTRGVAVAGSVAKSELPKSTHYLTAGPQQRVTLLRLPLISRSGIEIVIGEERFLEPRSKPRIRATYKAADRTMPNLPRNVQKSFFPGPADGISEPVAIYTS